MQLKLWKGLKKKVNINKKLLLETYEKTLFLVNVYGKLEEATQDMKNGRYSSVEDAVARIREITASNSY